MVNFAVTDCWSGQAQSNNFQIVSQPTENWPADEPKILIEVYKTFELVARR